MKKYTQGGTYDALGYHSARIATLEGRSPSSGSGAMHYEYDRERLINQSREFSRDNAIYKGIIERMVAYVIGNGFKLEIISKSKPQVKKIESLWNDYWKRPEVRGILSGARVERQTLREIVTAGDTGCLKIKSGLIQPVEAEQIKGPNRIADGIEKTDTGKPTGYYVSPYSRSGRVNTRESRKIKPDDFIFITDPDRPSSIRSVPALQASFPMLHRINDVCDSEAIAWQMLSKIAVSVTRDNAGALGYTESEVDAKDTYGNRIVELDNALMFHGAPGDEIKGVSHDLPGKDFPASLTMFLRLLGLPIGLPLEVILLDWTKSNYSQSRAVLEQAFQMFQSWQSLMELSFLNPILEWKAREWSAAGLITNQEYQISWIKPKFPWIDQLKEAQAQALKLDRGFETLSGVAKGLQTDRDKLLKVREQEIRNAISISEQIEKDTGKEVPYQLFCGLDVAKSEPVNEVNNDPKSNIN